VSSRGNEVQLTLQSGMEKKAPNANGQVADIADEKNRIMSVLYNSFESQIEEDDVCGCIDSLGAIVCDRVV